MDFFQNYDILSGFQGISSASAVACFCSQSVDFQDFRAPEELIVGKLEKPIENCSFGSPSRAGYHKVRRQGGTVRAAGDTMGGGGGP